MLQGKLIATPAETCPGRVPRCSGLAVRSARRGSLRGAGEPAGHDATVHGHLLCGTSRTRAEKVECDGQAPDTEPQLRALTPELSRLAKQGRLE